MAQIPDFIQGQNPLARWARVAIGVRVDDARTGAVATPRAHHDVAAEQAVRGLSERPKLSGLGLGERRILQALADSLVLFGGFALILLQSDRAYSRNSVAVSVALMAAIWFFFADAFEAYRMATLQHRFRAIYTAGSVLVVTVVSYVLLAWLTGGFAPVVRPRISETFTVLLLIAPLVVERIFVSSLLSHAPLRRRVAVVGANEDGREMVQALRRYDGSTYEFLGYFDDSPAMGGEDAHIVLPTAALVGMHARVGIDQVILANPMQTGPLLQTLSLLHERGTQITPMFALYQDLTGRVPVSHLGDDWYVALPAKVKKTNRTYGLIKRGFDLVLATAMVVVAAPVIPLIALAIKLDSPGPVLFKQVRVGRGGKPFKIVKFRSMCSNAELMTGPMWASRNDSRITRVGKLMRKSRLDEIPQLWNVLVGDMSFVGPRPERPEFDDELEREIPFYRARRAVRPGLTGWAQVNYGYGSTMLDALRKVEYDLYYIKNESFYLDLLIMLRTVAVVLKLGGR